jgi:hypothetical protein
MQTPPIMQGVDYQFVLDLVSDNFIGTGGNNPFTGFYHFEITAKRTIPAFQT